MQLAPITAPSTVDQTNAKHLSTCFAHLFCVVRAIGRDPMEFSDIFGSHLLRILCMHIPLHSGVARFCPAGSAPALPASTRRHLDQMGFVGCENA